jgi:hypothetical protein
MNVTVQLRVGIMRNQVIGATSFAASLFGAAAAAGRTYYVEI